jgi:hypothetical protein
LDRREPFCILREAAANRVMPASARVLGLVACLLVGAAQAGCVGTPRSAPPATVPGLDPSSAEAIAWRWFEQSHGFDGLEAYELLGFPVEFAFSVARRWDADRSRVQLFIRVDRPERFAKVAFLWTRHASGAESAHWNPGPFGGSPGRTQRIPSAPALGQAAPQGVPLDTLRPLFPGELVHQRLPETVMHGEPCDVLESRPAPGRALGFERVQLFISRRTGVALRTVYYQGEAELRRNLVDPADVRRIGERFLPMRRRIETASGASFELRLHNVAPDVTLPERIFSEHNLRVRRFPSF